MEKQIRSTIAKQHIQEVLNRATSAMSQAEILSQSEGICDRVTVYRILDRLLAEGEIHRAVGLDGITRFARCKSCEHGHKHQHDHVHFSCENCGEVICLDKIVPTLKLPRGYKIHEMNLMISGVCPSCN